MKINSQILSLPPLISTSWQNVSGLYTQNNKLIVELSSGTSVTLENLDPSVVESIFQAHSAYLENSNLQETIKIIPNSLPSMNGDAPIQLGITSLDNLGNAMQHMQHNPAFADAPDLPEEMLDKISAITRIVAPDETMSLPEAQQNCNCPHCQIARAIIKTRQPYPDPDQHPKDHQEDTAVSPEELAFQQWDIEQTGPKLFQVSNRLDANETYQVYLGDPIGCTCGQSACEHIPAVLKT